MYAVFLSEGRPPCCTLSIIVLCNETLTHSCFGQSTGLSCRLTDIYSPAAILIFSLLL